MLLVTGGVDTNTQLISSTEVYYPSAGEWREVPGTLPKPMEEVGVVTLNNKVLLFGEKVIFTGSKSLSIRQIIFYVWSKLRSYLGSQ